MSTNPVGTRLYVWSTIRLGLQVIRKKAITIIVIAVIARFIASQLASGINDFSETAFGLELTSYLGTFVFLTSMLLMWLAVVPMVIRTIESPAESTDGTFLDTTWSAAISHLQGFTPRLLIRSVGLYSVNILLGICLVGPLLVAEYSSSIEFLIVGFSIAIFAFWLSLRWTVAFPALVMEDLSIRQSLGRSWQRTKSQTLRVLWLTVLLSTMTLVLSGLLGGIVGLVFGLTSDIQNYSEKRVLMIGLALGQTIALVVYAPIITACYYKLSGTLRK